MPIERYDKRYIEDIAGHVRNHAQHRTATGSTGSGYFNVVAYGADVTGVNGSSAAFIAAIAAAQVSGGVVLVPPGTFKISNNVNVTIDVSMEFRDGATLSIDSGKKFRFLDHSGLDAGLYQIFSGAGTVDIGVGVCEHILPQWWGAVGDNNTDCTAAFNWTFAACPKGAVVKLVSGSYVISDGLDTISQSISIIGDGIGKSIINATSLLDDTGPVIGITGTITLETTVASAITEGDYSITLVDASGLSAGDYIFIRRKELNLTGTWTFTNGSANVTAAANGDAVAEVTIGDWICAAASYGWVQVSSITNDDLIVLTAVYAGDTVTDPIGDTKLHTDTELWINDGFGYANKSEHQQIIDIAGNVIDLARPAYDDYLGDTDTEVYVFGDLNVTCKDFEILCDTDEMQGLQILYAQHVRVENVKITGARERGLWLRKCIDVYIKGYTNYDTWFSGTTTSYGLKVDACSDVRATDCYCLDGRHAFDSGTGIILSGINRNIIVSNGQFAGRIYAMGNHENTEFMKVIHCQIDGGCAVGGDHLEVIGNTVRALNHADNTGHGVALYLFAGRRMNYTVIDNTFIETTNIGSASRGLLRIATETKNSGGNTLIKNNKFDMNGFTGNSAYIYTSGAGDTESIVIEGNSIIGSLTSGSWLHYSYSNQDGGSNKKVVYKDNLIVGAGIYFTGRADRLIIDGNIIEDSIARGIFLFDDGSGNGCLEFDICNNRITGSQGTGLHVQGDGNSSVSDAYIKNNIILNSNQHGTFGASTYDRSGITIRDLETCYIKDNILSDNQAVPTQVYGIYSYSTIDHFRVFNNEVTGNATAPFYFTATMADKVLKDNRSESQIEAITFADPLLINADLSEVFSVTATANMEVQVTNLTSTDGHVFTLIITDDGNGPWAITFTTNFADDVPDFATVASAVYPISFIYDGTAYRRFYREPITSSPGKYNVMDYGATGLGAVDDSAAFDAAITAATIVGGVVLVPSGTYKLSDDVTIPADVTVEFLDGAQISVDTTKTFLFSARSGLIAGLHHIFAGAGTVTLGEGCCREVYPQWAGAVGDDSTDCISAFTWALTAATKVGRIYVPQGKYQVSTPITGWPVAAAFSYSDSGIILQGAATGDTVIKYTGSTGYAIEVVAASQFTSSVCVGHVIKDIRIECASITDVDSGGGIKLTGSGHTIENVMVTYCTTGTAFTVMGRDVSPTPETGMTHDTNRDFTTTDGGATEKYAIKFTTPAVARWLHSLTVTLGKTGAPAGTIHAEIWSDAAGDPSAQLGGDSESITLTDLTTTPGTEETFLFGKTNATPTLTAATDYWLVLVTDGYTYADGVTEVFLRVDAGAGGADEFATYDAGGTSWSTSNDGLNHEYELRHGQPINNRIVNPLTYGPTGRVGRGFRFEDGAITHISRGFIAALVGIYSKRGTQDFNSTYFYVTNQVMDAYGAGWISFDAGCWLEAGATESEIDGTVTVTMLAPTVGGGYWNIGDESILTLAGGERAPNVNSYNPSVRPEYWYHRIITPLNGKWNTSSTNVEPVVDALALQGYAFKLDTQSEARQLSIYPDDAGPGQHHWGQLPAGTYQLSIWARDTNQVEHDFRCQAAGYSGGWSNEVLIRHTLTAEYRPYHAYFVVDEAMFASSLHGSKMTMLKYNADANDIYISHIEVKYLGPDRVHREEMICYNSLGSDADGQRESRVLFAGRQSGEEISALAGIQASHDGAADDRKGKLELMVNDGDERWYPPAVLTLDSDSGAEFAGAVAMPGQSAVSVHLSGDQTIAAGTPEIVEFDTELYDVGSDFNTTTHKFTAPADGKYLLTVQITFEVDSAGDYLKIYADVDGTSVKLSRAVTGYTYNHSVAFSSVLDLSSGEDLSIIAENADNNDQIEGDSDETWMEVTRLL